MSSNRHSPRETVSAFLAAVAERDFELARTFLCDQDFEHISPLARYDDPDRFVAGLTEIGRVASTLNRVRGFVNGDDVCDIVDVTVSLDRLRVQRIAHWAAVREGKIARIEVFFDPGETLPPAAGENRIAS